ncbi:hypothetical protein KFL_008090030 [Klebsormidium nitens]|uniref:Secreted protein n=1 Tax=Klebsormidium nitens TaxID=105231 RepID=A0A1Y1IN76_KLENI|nr:hypothetical protein KFL_008090030 [Klebsormidium nitens]|eukprot:GAQ91572.1 hypothetical protein KFL_008090030 [Klebsormidium nitens]
MASPMAGSIGIALLSVFLNQARCAASSQTVRLFGSTTTICTETGPNVHDAAGNTPPDLMESGEQSAETQPIAVRLPQSPAPDTLSARF